MTSLLAFVGRLLIALLFIISGGTKLADPVGTQAMLGAAGLPLMLAIPAGLFELAAGLALVVGLHTRLTSLALAAFCLVTAFFFHNNFLDPVQATALLKNLAIAGGLLCLTALDSVRWSYDAMRRRRSEELATHKAQLDARDQEVRAARAEGEASGARSREVSDSGIQGRTVVADAH